MTFLWYSLGFPNIIPALMCFLRAKWEELPSLQYLRLQSSEGLICLATVSGVVAAIDFVHLGCSLTQEYVVVLVSHGKQLSQAIVDLEAFLGNESKAFVTWYVCNCLVSTNQQMIGSCFTTVL